MMKPKSDYLDRPVFIHCCQDKTLTYRTKDEPVFNGRALPVFSVNTKDEAEALIVSVGRCQYEEHPEIPGKPWYKMTMDGEVDFRPYLEIKDLEAVTAKLQSRYEKVVRRK